MSEGAGFSPSERLLSLLSGQWISQALSTAASLGIADTLALGPLSLDDLARALECHPGMLGRLMAALVAEEVFAVDEAGRFSLTPIGAELTQDRLRPLAVFIGSESQWTSWSALPKALRTGRSAFELTHGADLYTWLRDHPEDARRYDEGIDPFTTEQAVLLAEHYDFSECRRVVDLGGGRGRLLIELLRRWPHLHGTLFDVPHVIEAARPYIEASGFAARATLQGGDFFRAVPDGADVYVLKHVLHNWSDERAVELLSRSREAMSEHGRVLVVEGVLLPTPARGMSRLMDLEMMVLFGDGRERSKADMKRLFDRAGLKLEPYTAPLGRFARLFVGRKRAGL